MMWDLSYLPPLGISRQSSGVGKFYVLRVRSWGWSRVGEVELVRLFILRWDMGCDRGSSSLMCEHCGEAARFLSPVFPSLTLLHIAATSHFVKH